MAPKGGGKKGGGNNKSRKHNRQKSKDNRNNKKSPQQKNTSPLSSSSSSSSPTQSNDINNNNNVNIVVQEETKLSVNEKEILESTVLDLKKQKEEELHLKKKENQKKNDERKKLLNDFLKKRIDDERKLKLEEEEKKKLIEKQKQEAKVELDELNYQLISIGAPPVSANGTIKRQVSPTNMDEAFKRKTLSRGMTSLFSHGGSGKLPNPQQFQQRSQMNLGEDPASLKKFPSYSSLGIKASSNLFKTISVPRVSKGQVALQDIFKNNSNSMSNSSSGSLDGSKSPPPPSMPTGHSLSDLKNGVPPHSPPRPTSHHSKYGTVNLNSKEQLVFIKDEQSTKGAQERWGEYVKTLLAGDQEQLRQKRMAAQKLQAEINQQKQVELQQQLQQKLTSSQNQQPTATTAAAEEEKIKEDKLKVIPENHQQPHPPTTKEEEVVVTEDNQVKKDIQVEDEQITITSTDQNEDEEDLTSSKDIEEDEIIETEEEEEVEEIEEEEIEEEIVEEELEEEEEIEEEEVEEEEATEQQQEGEVEGEEPKEFVPIRSLEDANIIIEALQKKRPIPKALKEYKPTSVEEFKTTSQRPPDIVNIFKYGTINIDFSDIFGETEDLQGFIMWTVTEFGVEERDFDDYPLLYSKDSYIILNMSDNPTDSKMYNIHIWTGKESPQDRVGTSVMMAIQLATHLGGKVNHFKEDQGQESQLFISYFHSEDFSGIKYKNGGNGTDFNVVPKQKETGPTTLLKIDIPLIGVKSGKVNVRRVALSKKYVKSAAPEMAFVMENNDRVYIKMGSKASLETKTLARTLARDYASFYNANTKVIDVVGEVLEKEFYKYISDHKTKDDMDKDFKMTDEDETIVNLYKTTTKVNGKLDLESLAEEYPIDCQKVLTNDEVFILDCTTDVFVWSPIGISRKKVVAGRECAKMFYNEYERPRWSKMIQCKQYQEHPLFKHQFQNWWKHHITNPSSKSIVNYSRPPSYLSHILNQPIYYNFYTTYNNIIDEIIQPVLLNDPSDLIDAYSITLPDLQFYKMDQSEKFNFYQDDCYMVIVSSRKVNYKSMNEPQTTIYWWEGVHADPKGFPSFVHGLYPIIAGKFKDKGQLAPRMCLVTQRKETNHFMNLFDNRLVIHRGSRFDEADINDKIYQLVIQGVNIYIQQIDQNTSLLNSYNVYFIISPLNETITIWKGSFSFYLDGDLELYASYLDLSYKIKHLKQANTYDNFWTTLPGLKKEIIDISTRKTLLYKFYFGKDSDFKVEKVTKYYPSDLSLNQCALLETQFKLYFWIGQYASETLKNMSTIFVNDYFKLITKSEKPIKKVYQYKEPLKFKLQFQAWDKQDAFIDPLESIQYKLSLERTLEYRKQCQEEQELLAEYLDYASTLGDEDDLEDFETWVLIKKGAISPHDPTTPPSELIHHEHTTTTTNNANNQLKKSSNQNIQNNNNNNNTNHNNNNNSSSKSTTSPVTSPIATQTKKKKFLGIFNKK